jgi:hypothetical protein
VRRAAQDFVLHYLSAARHVTHLYQEIALDLKTAIALTTPSFESMNCFSDADSVCEAQTRLRQKSVRRMPLLTNSDANC